MLAGVRHAIRMQRPVALLGLAVVGLLAVAAVASSAQVRGGVRPSGSGGLAPQQAGGLFVAAFAALLVISAALAVVIVYSLAGSRRRKKGPDNVDWVSEPLPAGPLEKVLSVVIALLLLGGLVAALVFASRGAHHQTLPPPPVPSALATNGGVSASGAPLAGGGAQWVEIGTAFGAFCVVSAAILFLLLPRLRRRAAKGPGPFRTPGRAAVAEAVSLSIEDLEHERDPRRAIIAAYARMERSLAGAGLPRASHETATEYLQRILAAASAPAGALSQLTLLFQEAKFSHHALTATQRERALGALSMIREAMAA